MAKKVNYRELAAVFMGSLVFALIALYLEKTTREEAFGFVTGVTGVWLAAKNHSWNWPIGLLNAAIFVFIYMRERLYPDAALYVFFVLSGIYGWYFWLRGGEKQTEAPIASVPAKEWPITVLIGLASTALIVWWMYAIKSAAPFLDTSAGVVSVIAQYWMTRRYIQCWVLWLIVDVVYVPLYWWKGLYLPGCLFLVYLVIAYFGLREWTRQWERESGVPRKMPGQAGLHALLAASALFSAWMAVTCLNFERGVPEKALAAYRDANNPYRGKPVFIERQILDPRTGAGFGQSQRLSDEAKLHLLSDLLDPLLYHPLKHKPTPDSLPVQRLRFVEEGKDGQLVELLKYEIFLDHARVEGQIQSLYVWERVKRYVPAP